MLCTQHRTTTHPSPRISERNVSRPPSNSVVIRSPSDTGPSSTRHAEALWRSPLGARYRSVADRVASASAGAATHSSRAWSNAPGHSAAYTGGYTIPNGVGVAFLVAPGVYGYSAYPSQSSDEMSSSK